MEITDLAVPSLERVGRTRGTGDARSVRASMDFHCDYGRLFDFLLAIEGVPETLDLGGGNTVDVKIPLRFPDFPADHAIQLFADRYSWEGVDYRAAAIVEDPPPDPLPAVLAPGPAGTGWNTTHLFARVTVEFARPEFNWSDSVFVSRRNRIGARIVTIPGAPYRFAPTASLPARGFPINQDVGIILPTQEVRLTRHWAPDIEAIEAAVLDLIYHTNSTAMTIGGKTWAPGCVLFAGFDSDEQRGGFGGRISSRVDYSFLVDAAGWDKVMSDITGLFEPVTPIIYPRGAIGVALTL